jgi:hypothetical protein
VQERKRWKLCALTTVNGENFKQPILFTHPVRFHHKKKEFLQKKKEGFEKKLRKARSAKICV